MAYFPAKVTDYGDNFYGIEINIAFDYSPLGYHIPFELTKEYDFNVIAPNKNLSLDNYDVIIPKISFDIATTLRWGYPNWNNVTSSRGNSNLQNNLKITKGSSSSKFVITQTKISTSSGGAPQDGFATSDAAFRDIVFYLRKKK